ncbi:AAA family ATPase [Planomonospora corallina]|uniref:AAA family ATPase n=1 Tax=Planomonospora corallina TaxID=1806052 RepID=A0ABV8IMF2_9ACTN
MARHDREESLEEQLAWLDAIKEQEEAPPAVVSAQVTAGVDDAAGSPYPQDPWSLVPSETDAASSPLFRAAADPEHGSQAGPSAAADTPAEDTADRPIEEADAAEWAEAVEAVNSFTLPSVRPPKDNDGFLTPLKPLPRQEADPAPGELGSGSYALDGFGPGSDSDTGRFVLGGTDADADRSSFGGPDSGTGWSAFRSSDSGTGWSAFGNSDADRFGSAGSDADRFGSAGSDADRPGSGGSDVDRFASGGSDADADRFTGGDTDPGHGRFAVQGEQPPAPMGPFRLEAPESFGSDRPAVDAPAEAMFSPEDASGGPTAFVRGRETTLGAEGERPSFPGTVPAAGHGGVPAAEWDRASASTQDTPVRADGGFTPDRDATFAPDRGPASDLGPVPERGTAEPVREPYQPRRRQAPPQPAFGSPARQQTTGAPRPSADSLDPDSLLRGRRNGPSGGWRKFVFKASAGLIKPGESPEVRRRRELLARARTPVATGHHRVAVLSLKGGVGKTTTTVGLGATLAQARGDRVIAVDANPDRGTLSDKLELETAATVRDLLNERAQIKRYVDIRAFTSQAPSRLEILASDRDPSVSEAFSAADYQAVAQVLENFYSICITDCGTGLLHSAMSGVLGLADQLVLVSSPSVDGARAASATLDWLEAHHYEDLVRAATVVLCNVRPRSKSTVDLDRLEAHFAARCRAVVRIPYDPHLEEGAEIDLDRLLPGTRDAYLRLAASVGDGFAVPQS